MKNIWVFAEERSGSTWFSTTLTLKFGLRYRYVEEDREEIPDDEWAKIVDERPYDYPSGVVYQTHRFQILSSLHRLESPTVFRTTRRDILKQFVSYIFMERVKEEHPEWWKLPHLYKEPRSSFEIRADKFLGMVGEYDGITISKKEADNYLQKKAIRDSLWNQYTGIQTIYYEDLCSGVDIPALGLSGFGFESGGIFAKLPYKPESLIKNLDNVRGWLSGYLNR